MSVAIRCLADKSQNFRNSTCNQSNNFRECLLSIGKFCFARHRWSTGSREICKKIKIRTRALFGNKMLLCHFPLLLIAYTCIIAQKQCVFRTNESISKFLEDCVMPRHAIATRCVFSHFRLNNSLTAPKDCGLQKARALCLQLMCRRHCAAISPCVSCLNLWYFFLGAHCIAWFVVCGSGWLWLAVLPAMCLSVWCRVFSPDFAPLCVLLFRQTRSIENRAMRNGHGQGSCVKVFAVVIVALLGHRTFVSGQFLTIPNHYTRKRTCTSTPQTHTCTTLARTTRTQR